MEVEIKVLDTQKVRKWEIRLHVDLFLGLTDIMDYKNLEEGQNRGPSLIFKRKSRGDMGFLQNYVTELLYDKHLFLSHSSALRGLLYHIKNNEKKIQFAVQLRFAQNKRTICPRGKLTVIK